MELFTLHSNEKWMATTLFLYPSPSLMNQYYPCLLLMLSTDFIKSEKVMQSVSKTQEGHAASSAWGRQLSKENAFSFMHM